MDIHDRSVSTHYSKGPRLIAQVIGSAAECVEQQFAEQADCHWGSVGDWVDALIHRRVRLKGLGEARVQRLRAAMELASLVAYEELCARPSLSSPKECERFLRQHLTGRRREVFCALYLNCRNRLLACDDLFEGTIDAAVVYPRDLAARALSLGASAVIVAHNHPSGCSVPSEADRHITRRVRDALALLDIRLLDHLIVGRGAVYSMASYGDIDFHTPRQP